MSILKEPKWQKYQVFLHQTLSNSLKDWLLEPGSLTARLIANSDHFEVKLLRQGFGKPFMSEYQSLNILPNRFANIREVLLICDGKPWVFARTIIPVSTLCGKEKALLKLGTTSLGHLLFQYPDVQRSPFEIAQVLPEHYQYQRASQIKSQKNILYARRSVFEINGKPLSVSETFTEHCQFPIN